MSKILCMGDIHGDYGCVARVSNTMCDDGDIVIQVGDFGVSKHFVDDLENRFAHFKHPVYFIDGNHENFDVINSWSKTKVTEVYPNLFYVPRGTVLTLNGKRIGFLGGGESVDKAYRQEGVNWFPSECISEEDVKRLITNVGNTPLDILVTHVPPTEFINRNWPPLNKKSWGLSEDWIDMSAQMVERAYHLLRPKKMYFGHMHGRITDGNMRLLDINEVVEAE